MGGVTPTHLKLSLIDWLLYLQQIALFDQKKRIYSENKLTIEDTKSIISNHSSETMEVVIEVFSGSLDWASEEILSLLKKVPSDSLIPRLIRNSPSIEVDSIRAKLLLGKCNDIRKMRYLEDLIGRKIGRETLSSLQKISEEIDEGPVRSMALEVLHDRSTLGRGEVSNE